MKRPTSPTDHPAQTPEDEVRVALRDCYDPALPCNIVDLGFLRSLTVSPDPDAPGSGIPGVPPRHRVAITLTPAQQDDTVEAHLRAQVLNRLAGLPAVSRAELHFRYTPAWSPRDITAPGRRTLGLDGNPTLVQIR